MRPVVSVMLLLFLLILATTAQGIRLDEESLAAFHKIIHGKGSLMEGESGDGGAAVICRDDGHCSGWSRKLMTKTMTTSKSAKSNKTDAGSAESHHSGKVVDINREDFHVERPVSEHAQLPAEAYPDSLDIAGMDYSPAKRKPPIHN